MSNDANDNSAAKAVAEEVPPPVSDAVLEAQAVAAAGSPDEASSDDPSVHASATLGVDRWVYLAFLIGTAITFWMLRNLITLVWDRITLAVDTVPEPQPLVVVAAALILAIGGALATFRNPNANGFVREVAEEYGRITWPTREEAMNHTVVVIAVSLVATVILAVFDYAWGALSDLLYQA